METINIKTGRKICALLLFVCAVLNIFKVPFALYGLIGICIIYIILVLADKKG